MGELKKTPLYPVYRQYGAKTIDFGGWDLPVQFSGIKEEHEAVRTKAGLFDVSHMGEISVKGPDSLAFVQKMITNDASSLTVGRAQYTALCYEDGGTVDDILVYKRGEEHYWLVVNAANTEKDFEWLQHNSEGYEISIENESASIAQLALQGPAAEQVLQKLTENTDLKSIAFFRFKENVLIAGKDVLVSRTGYTGEDGFELYCSADDAIHLWNAILEAPEVKPIGLGARDTLRFEAGLPLYGQELSESISPIEAGIGFAVKVNKGTPFIGQQALKQQKENGTGRKLVGVEMIGRGIPRHGYPVYAGDNLIGEVTTGTQSPTLKKNIGYALVDRMFSDAGTEVTIGIRSKQIEAKVVPAPFYSRKKNV
ncbi:MAG: glycine cleavage system aminomethyltransferase GcvT [Bacillus sp. (in: firmicutes)]